MSEEIRLTESVTLQILQQILNLTCGSIFGFTVSRKKKREKVTEEYTDTVGLSCGLVSEGIIIIIT